jgi:hypothetical protein
VPESLSWSFNPWKEGLGGWRRPQLALPLSILLAILLSWSVTVPNTPVSMEQELLAAREELGSAPFAIISGRQLSRSEIEGQLEQIDAQREQFMGQWLLWSLVTILMILGMTAPLYLPAQYRLDDKGVTVRFAGVPSMRRWEHYRNFYPHKRIVHLTTLPRPSALDPFRGHSLCFDGNRDEVLAFLTRHVQRTASPGS